MCFFHFQPQTENKKQTIYKHTFAQLENPLASPQWSKPNR